MELEDLLRIHREFYRGTGGMSMSMVLRINGFFFITPIEVGWI